MPRGDGRKPGEPRGERQPNKVHIIPYKLVVRQQDWLLSIKDKQGYRKPGSQNPRKN